MIEALLILNSSPKRVNKRFDQLLMRAFLAEELLVGKVTKRVITPLTTWTQTNTHSTNLL
jgi:hypothetical protein